MSSDEFRRACGRFATGVTVAAATDSSGIPHGLTVSSFTSVSLDPPLILICLGHEVSCIEIFRAASHVGISVLAEDQQHISERFAQKGRDKFDGLDWRAGDTGAPLLAGALAEMECAVRRQVTAGDHDIFVTEMIHGRVREGNPLIYFAGRYQRLSRD